MQKIKMNHHEEHEEHEGKEFEELCHRVIGCAIEAHRFLTKLAGVLILEIS